MSASGRTTVAVAFGGASPEHEVSVISAHQVLAAIDPDRFEAVPVYVGKDGRWYVGGDVGKLAAYTDLGALRSSAIQVTLRPGTFGQLILVPERRGLFRKSPQPIAVDVMFLAFHGGSGEDGGVQGLCESFGVAYTGSGILASSVGMDKVVSKQLCREAGIPVVEYVGVSEWEWAGSEDAWLDVVEDRIGFPVVVKPARLGSSIGIEIAKDRASLDRTIEEAFRFDSKIVVERAVTRLKEINCSVLGWSDSVRLSALEQPVGSEAGQLLTFADKYQRGSSEGASKRGEGESRGASPAKRGTEMSSGMASLDRIIPAPVDSGTEARIREIAAAVFRLFDCAGVARIDFLIDEDTDTVFFNEINTLPGSFSFYLWDPVGIDFTRLVTELIEIALSRHRSLSARVRTYDVNLLSERSVRGLKGAKSGSRRA